jgi:hypothetical protein
LGRFGENQVTKQLFFGGHQGFFGVFGKIKQSLAPFSGKIPIKSQFGGIRESKTVYVK